MPSFPIFRIGKVTSLGPRTPHQPEKLKKLSKNECLFTPSILGVNEKAELANGFVFNRVQAVHRRMPGFGAGLRIALIEKTGSDAEFAFLVSEGVDERESAFGVEL